MSNARVRPVRAVSGTDARGSAVLAGSDRRQVEQFVRGALGCGCPEEAFRSIVVDREVANRGRPFTRLVIGKRLLVYVVEPQSGVDLETETVELVTAGRAERDACGLNRFRLVLAPAQPMHARSDLAAWFSRAVGADDRAHLHLLSAQELPAALLAR